MNVDRTRASAVFGGILILLGVIFLLGQFINIDFGHYLWPFFIIGFGALFFIGMVAGGPSMGGLAIPGSIIVTIGLILLVQNFFNIWESWSYAWGLLLSAVGVGIVIQGFWTRRPDLRVHGWRLVRLGLIFFFIFGAFFELFIFRSSTLLGKVFWPLVLILIGIYIVITRMLRPAPPPAFRDQGYSGPTAPPIPPQNPNDPGSSEPPLPPNP
jgi:hypothetical protein